MKQGGLMAHVNDSIRELAGAAPEAETWQFICECADVACHALVTLTLTEFDERRAAAPPLPVLAEHAA
jgi:hypothetical protein